MNKFNTILLNVNNEYEKTGIYEAARKAWIIGDEKDNLKYAVAVYKGQAIEVFEIKSWQKSKTPRRWEFYGKVASSEVRNKYVGKKFRMYGPIQYIK